MGRKMQDCIAEGKELFVGLEDSKKSWKLCVRSRDSVVHETSMPAEFGCLKAYLSRFPGCRVSVMYEAGFKGFTLHDQLQDIGVMCVVLPPHLLLQPKVSRVKTDRRDAKKLSYLLMLGEFSACRVPDPERRSDRQIVRTLNAVEKHIKSTRNRIRKLLDFHGIDSGITKRQWQKSDYRCLNSLELPASVHVSLSVLLRLLDTFWHEQRLLRKELKALTQKKRYAEAMRIVSSFPGIGWLTAIRFILELGEDIATLKSGKALASFLGLTGREDSTGERVRKGRITGLGNRFVRSWFIESAWTAIRRDPVLQAFYRRVQVNTGSGKKAIVAVARKMAVRLYTCMKLKTEYSLGLIH